MAKVLSSAIYATLGQLRVNEIKKENFPAEGAASKHDVKRFGQSLLRETIQKLVDAGMTYEEIGLKLKMKPSTVSRIATR